MLFLYIESFFNFIFAIPIFIKDLFFYFKNKTYKDFSKWGLHLFVGKFGAGKTTTMVHYAYKLAKKYPQLTILTNLNLTNFPKYTNILLLNSIDDILAAPVNCLVLIDEIGTLFNSRDFANKDNSLPKILFQYLCQCRKRKLMIYGTVQRWNFLDKQLRDICDTVYSTKTFFKHPFSRIAMVCRFDAYYYDLAFSNPLMPLPLMSASSYIQTDFLRSLFTTEQLISSLLKMTKKDFIDEIEILQNRSSNPLNLSELTTTNKKTFNRNQRKF